MGQDFINKYVVKPIQKIITPKPFSEQRKKLEQDIVIEELKQKMSNLKGKRIKENKPMFEIGMKP